AQMRVLPGQRWAKKNPSPGLLEMPVSSAGPSRAGLPTIATPKNRAGSSLVQYGNPHQSLAGGHLEMECGRCGK
ncbi:MAG: hypothetical protein ACRDV9_03560, partial [Acidimicrobiia bacterium]